MEAKCLSKAEHLSSDVISTLPQIITETILCLIPIEEAARTSILSRDWRYKWTTIPKLEFHMSATHESTTEEKNTRCKFFNAIHQVLLMRQGPIHEFTLSISIHRCCFEIDQILFYLSRNHAVKKLTLLLKNPYMYKLPMCAFSLHQLTYLYLDCMNLDLQPVFNGFGSLKTLCLNHVIINTKALFHLLSRCPLLTSFTLYSFLGAIAFENCNLIELFECLPMIEHLTLYGYCILLSHVLDSIPDQFPTPLVHLEYFCFKQMWFVDEGLPFLGILIQCSPNLKKIRLEITSRPCRDDDEIFCGILEKSDVWLEHLNEMEIENFSNLRPEMEFVRFILARSPKLKKVCISSMVETDEEQLEMLKILLRAPRASSVEIVVE